jgi:2-aminoadipate transaminase
MRNTLPDVQLSLRPGIIDFGWGHPDPALLPVEGLSRAARLALDSAGRDALAYGAEQGPGHLIELLCERLGRLEGVELPADQLLITGGVSQALDLLCTLLTQPGDVMLAASPIYHLALRIFRDHGLELVPVPSDADGLRVDALEEIWAELQEKGQEPKMLYLVPTFCNPTGVTLAAEQRDALVALARRTGLLILEDDVYHELWYDAPPLHSLYSLAPSGPVVRLGSFSKILAPGLRLGWMLAAPEIVKRCTGCGMLDSGGGVNHFTAHVVSEFIETGALEEHVEVLRSAYRRRRDALLEELAHHLPGCSWARPGGGFFVWLRLPEGVNSAELLPAAEEQGVSYLPGSLFHSDEGGDHFCRLAFTLLEEDELREGVRRLALALQGKRP